MNRHTSKTTILALALALVIGCAKARGQIAALQIDGPREAEPCQLISLRAKTTAGETPFWIVLEPSNLDYDQVDNGNRLIFATGCQSQQRITVLLLAQQVQDQRIVTRQIRRTIIVGDSPGGIPAPSDPPAAPVPEVPNWKDSPLFGAVTAAWPDVQTDAAKSLSNEVAANFDKVANQIDRQQITQLAQIWTTISQANRSVLKIETTAWKPVATAVQVEFQRLQLPAVRTHAFHLRAAAAAIRQAFQNNNNAKSSNQKAIIR